MPLKMVCDSFRQCFYRIFREILKGKYIDNIKICKIKTKYLKLLSRGFSELCFTSVLQLFALVLKSFD